MELVNQEDKNVQFLNYIVKLISKKRLFAFTLMAVTEAYAHFTSWLSAQSISILKVLGEE